MTTLLAFDTSGPHCSAALMMNGTIVSAHHEAMTRGQSERLFPLCDDILTRHGTTWQNLDAIGVGIGPGNFTGIRIAVSAARGLALSLGIPAIGITGFDALRGLQRDDDPQPMIVSLPTARRGSDVILQFYQNAAPVGDPVEMGIPRTSDDAGFNGFPTQATVLGHAANSVDAALQNNAGGATELNFDADTNQAAHIAEIAARRLQTCQDIPKPKPLYLRPADAAPSSDPRPVILP